GQITGPLLVRSSGAARVLGIRFHPHGASAVLGLPVRELANSIEPAEGLSRRLWEKLQRLCDLGSPFAAVARLDRIFGNPAVACGYDAVPVVASVRHFERTAGQVRIATIASAAGLSLRQFQRRFREAVGISPKLFSRMQRFQRVFQAAEA